MNMNVCGERLVIQKIIITREKGGLQALKGSERMHCSMKRSLYCEISILYVMVIPINASY